MPTPPTTNEKLDAIIGYLQRFEKREKWKMWGSLIRNIIALIPIIIVVVATWYTVVNADKLLQKITSMAAEQAGRVASQNTSGLIEQFNNFIKK